MTDGGYQVDATVLAGGDRIAHDLAARAEALASELGGVFSQLTAASGQNALSGALADASSATSRCMTQAAQLFAHIGDRLRSTADAYEHTDSVGASAIQGLQGGLR
jgi:PPE-repeat protein